MISWEVYLVVNQPIEQSQAGRAAAAFPASARPDGPGAHGPRPQPRRCIAGGAWFTQAGVQPMPGSTTDEQAIQAVLGEGIARELGQDKGKPSLEVGDVFPMAERQWIVVGILQSCGSTFDSEIWAKQQIVGEKFGKPSYSTVVLRTADAEAAQEAAADLSANFKSRRWRPRSRRRITRSSTRRTSNSSSPLLVVAGFMALGGVFGIMNTMFAAISQRQKDIGVLRILGYARWQILESFFLESLMLALIGGAHRLLAGHARATAGARRASSAAARAAARASCSS